MFEFIKENVILLTNRAANLYKNNIPPSVQDGIQSSLSSMGRWLSKGWELAAGALTALGGSFQNIKNRASTAVAFPSEAAKGYSEKLPTPSAVLASATSAANYVKERVTSNVTYLYNYAKGSQAPKVVTNDAPVSVSDETLTTDDERKKVQIN